MICGVRDRGGLCSRRSLVRSRPGSSSGGVSWVEWYVPSIFTVLCGVANMATRRTENRVARSVGTVTIFEFRRGRQFGDPPPMQLSGTFNGESFDFRVP